MTDDGTVDAEATAPDDDPTPTDLSRVTPEQRDVICTWLKEHGLTPNRITPEVGIADDGTVTLVQLVYRADGTPLVSQSKLGEPELVFEYVTITPSRPFPLP